MSELEIKFRVVMSFYINKLLGKDALLFCLIELVLVILKMSGNISASWLLVSLPLIIFGVFLTLLGLMFTIYGFILADRRRKLKKNVNKLLGDMKEISEKDDI